MVWNLMWPNIFHFQSLGIICNSLHRFIKIDIPKVTIFEKIAKIRFCDDDWHKCKHFVVYTRDHPIFFVIMSYFDKWSTWPWYQKRREKIYHSNIKNKLGGPAASIYYSPSFTSHDRSHSNTTLLNPAETVKITWYKIFV